MLEWICEKRGRVWLDMESKGECCIDLIFVFGTMGTRMYKRGILCIRLRRRQGGKKERRKTKDIYILFLVQIHQLGSPGTWQVWPEGRGRGH